MFLNNKGFGNSIVMLVIGGLLGAIFITGVYVWQEIEGQKDLNAYVKYINKQLSKKEKQTIENFQDCLAAGLPVLESQPRQCIYGGQIFVEDAYGVDAKLDLIRLEYPLPGQPISSPLTIRGEARGYWFFEASFPVFLTNWDGLIIAEGVAQAQSDWMTEDFVPFEVELTFDKPDYGINGALILKKDNPSGLPENDDALEIPVIFE